MVKEVKKMENRFNYIVQVQTWKHGFFVEKKTKVLNCTLHQKVIRNEVVSLEF